MSAWMEVVMTGVDAIECWLDFGRDKLAWRVLQALCRDLYESIRETGVLEPQAATSPETRHPNDDLLAAAGRLLSVISRLELNYTKATPEQQGGEMQ